jgi:hypothetical protein
MRTADTKAGLSGAQIGSCFLLPGLQSERDLVLICSETGLD